MDIVSKIKKSHKAGLIGKEIQKPVSTTKDRKERAMLIPEKPETDIRITKQAIRPLRLAFLIDQQTPEEQLLELISYNTSIWGGRYNYFFPVANATIKDAWWQTLYDFDPDKVILCTPIIEELRSKISQYIQPYQILQWPENNIQEINSNGVDGLRSLSILYVLESFYKEMRPIDRSNICTVIPRGTTPYRLSEAIHFGNPNEELLGIYEKAFKGERVRFSGEDLGDYLNLITSLESKISPIQVTGHSLSMQAEFNSGILGGTLVIINDDSPVEDFCVCWNLLNSQPQSFSKGVFAIPYSALRDENNLGVLAEWCNKNIQGTNTITLASASISVEDLIRIKERFNPLLAKVFQFVDIWFDQFYFTQFRAHQVEQVIEIKYSGQEMMIPIHKSDWGEKVRSDAEWVADIDLSDSSKPLGSFIPPRYHGLNYLLSGKFVHPLIPSRSNFSIRSSMRYLSLRTNRSMNYWRIKLPYDGDLFLDMLTAGGNHAKKTDKCRYASGMLKLLGDLRDVRLFEKPGLRALFYALSKGITLTIGEMNSYLLPGSEKKNYRDAEVMISALALKGIFMRGYQLHCPECDLRRWYSLAEVTEKMRCAGCLTTIQLPIDAPFHYRLNELFARGIEQGAIPLLMTARLLTTFASYSYLYMPGVEVTCAGKNVDIDILATCDGQLVGAECKDFTSGMHQEVIDALKEQLSDILNVMLSIGVNVFVLGALTSEVPQELQKFIDQKMEEHEELTIIVATVADLEKGYLEKEGSTIPKKMFDLLRTKPRKKKGVISEPGLRQQAF